MLALIGEMNKRDGSYDSTFIDVMMFFLFRDVVMIRNTLRSRQRSASSGSFNTGMSKSRSFCERHLYGYEFVCGGFRS